MNREQTISRVTIGGAIGNLLLAAFKLAAGLLGQSAAMMADAIHSISDLISDVIVLVMVKVSSKAADKGHDYGHGKYETLATVIVAIMLLVVGSELMVSGLQKINVVMDGGELAVPGIIALVAALVSILVKELLYQWTARVGKRVNSPAMISNAWHHRTDALSSIGSALGIGGAMLLGGQWAVLDPLVCCAISIFIIVISVKMIMPALHELTEGSLSEEVENDVVSLITSVEGVDNVHELKTRRNGPTIIISAHIVVDPKMTVSEAHHITVLAENAVRSKYGKETLISIHIEPDEEAE
ncbi:MAG: cation diffusion facilitator family transporter [Paludibacteraceae bacterium]|nr:cation diffusion facilitator family transporter [Paludibacteraceae bacterium]